MSIWKAHNEIARDREPSQVFGEVEPGKTTREIAAAMQAGEETKTAGECIWPACGHGQSRGGYCLYHYDLLVGAGIIEDKDHARRMDEILKAARVRVAALYPRNPEYQKWDDEDDEI